MSEPLDALATIHYGKSPNEVISVDGGIPIVGTGGIYGWANCAMFDKGVVVARKGSLGTPHLFKVPFWPVDTTYAVVPRSDVDLDWLYYCLLNFDLTKLNEATGVPSINRNWLAKTRFPNPGWEQQKKVAAILTAIDAAIEKTEALIAKYQQVKAGLMQDLFTRGVQPNGQLRPPRSEAPELYQETVIGWIPMEWQVFELGNACEQIVDCPHSTPTFLPNGVLVARTMHIKNSVFLEDEASHVSEQEYLERIGRAEPSPGDVILTREAPVGEAFVIPVGMKICLGQRVMLVKPLAEVLDSDYLVAQIYSGALSARIAELTAGTTNPHLNVADVRSLLLTVPPYGEQLRMTSRINALNARIRIQQKLAAKMRTQKLGLMQDLLTGKVPV